MANTPKVALMEVFPVAGKDSMELNLSGAHAPYFTRNVVVLTDNRGNVGIGEVPGGGKITKVLEQVKMLVEGTSIGDYKMTLRKINELAGKWYLATAGKLEQAESDLDSLYSDDPVQRAREERFTESLYGGNSKLNTWIDSRKEAFLDLYYWVLRRVALFVVLLPLWIPLAILAVFHGL